MTRDLDQWSVRLYEPGRFPQTVFISDTKQEAQEFARECRADTVGPCRFLVVRRNVFMEQAELLATAR